MTREELLERERQLIAAEIDNPPGWWYLSFATVQTDDEPSRFLGACIVQGQGPTTALDRSRRLRINPGGEVLTMPVSDEAVARLPQKYKEKLLSKADLAEMDAMDAPKGEKPE